MKRLALSLPLAALVAAFAAGAPSAATQTVNVTETSYKIRFSTAPRAGTVRFVIVNASDDLHNFRLRGGGVSKTSRMLTGGNRAVLAVALKKGMRYQVWCTIGDHAAEGMRTSFVAR